MSNIHSFGSAPTISTSAPASPITGNDAGPIGKAFGRAVRSHSEPMPPPSLTPTGRLALTPSGSEHREISSYVGNDTDSEFSTDGLVRQVPFSSDGLSVSGAFDEMNASRNSNSTSVQPRLVRQEAFRGDGDLLAIIQGKH